MWVTGGQKVLLAPSPVLEINPTDNLGVDKTDDFLTCLDYLQEETAKFLIEVN